MRWHLAQFERASCNSHTGGVGCYLITLNPVRLSLEGEPWDEYRKDSDCENRFNSDLFDTEDFDDDLD